MSESSVLVFFYGSYINRKVLSGVDLEPERFEIASLPGWDITIGPLANVVPAEGATVWGVVATLTHAELDRLYAHARDVLGGEYFPHPVLVATESSPAEPALCYVADELPEGRANADYVGRILTPARELGFPADYLARLESFLPTKAEGTAE